MNNHFTFSLFNISYVVFFYNDSQYFKYNSFYFMEKQFISLSPKGLKNLVANPSDEFTFIVGSDYYTVHRSLAEYISPVVAELHNIDTCADFYMIDVDDDCKRFKYVLDLMKGENISISSIDALTLCCFAEKLGNQELYEKLQKVSQFKITNDTVVPSLINKYQIGFDYTEELQYVSLHFYELSPSDREELPLPLLELIFQSPLLKVESEDDLFDFVYSLVKKKGKQYRVLYEYLWFDFLNESSISKFLKKTNLTDLNSIMWDSISKRLLMKVNPVNGKSADRYLQGTIPFVGDPFKGIIDNIMKETGENPHLSGTVKISYFGGNPYCEKLFDYDWKCYWSSTSCPGQWISFEFTKNYIYLTDYTMKTPNNNPGWNHLKNWIIEGSNDGKEWEMLDNRENNDDLNGNSKIATFHCQNPQRVRFVRLRQTGKNHRDSDDIQLTNIEFFGRLSDYCQC
ncbi:F5/8 type C domain containing protein [Tritrichomonas foetus]|uniref:F5/8 type C domain containing protein n=1 Tax=Tritrichomonas foetus TaxID=1144522 RepID=A0A1J4K573_9EUKA|nr:F5/8 type C domain containing protein [Tritrichomonas foetus]|eukprot:OHT06130.1 F5/8 type C domain containing protein [Tritrichomonas foetus]